MKGNYQTMQDFLGEIGRREQAKHDWLAEHSSLRMADDSTLSLLDRGDGSHRRALTMLPNAHGQLADTLRVPKRFYDEIGQYPGMRSDVVNRLLDEIPGRRMVRELDGKARAIVSDRYKPFDNVVAVNGLIQASEGWGSRFEVKSLSLTDTRMYLQIVFPSLVGEPRVGDPVQYGVTISNSEVGRGAFDVRDSVWRLVCSNGMVGESVLRRQHVGRRIGDEVEDYAIYSDETLNAELESFRLRLRDTVKHALNPDRWEGMVNTMRAAAHDEVTSAVSAVENVTRRFSLGESERDSILNVMFNESAMSRWGIVNGITALAHETEDRDRQYEIERMGHEILTLPRKDWEIIAA